MSEVQRLCRGKYLRRWIRTRLSVPDKYPARQILGRIGRSTSMAPPGPLRGNNPPPRTPRIGAAAPRPGCQRPPIDASRKPNGPACVRRRRGLKSPPVDPMQPCPSPDRAGDPAVIGEAAATGSKGGPASEAQCGGPNGVARRRGPAACQPSLARIEVRRRRRGRGRARPRAGSSAGLSAVTWARGWGRARPGANEQRPPSPAMCPRKLRAELVQVWEPSFVDRSGAPGLTERGKRTLPHARGVPPHCPRPWTLARTKRVRPLRVRTSSSMGGASTDPRASA